MPDKIEPALSAAEWMDALSEDVREKLAYEVTYLWGKSRPAAAIAIANDALPDSDRRKITREKIDAIRRAESKYMDIDNPRQLDDFQRVTRLMIEFADALEAYLPPA